MIVVRTMEVVVAIIIVALPWLSRRSKVSTKVLMLDTWVWGPDMAVSGIKDTKER